VRRNLQLPPADLREEELLQAAAADHPDVHRKKSYIYT
jgi:hypothetical protein